MTAPNIPTGDALPGGSVIDRDGDTGRDSVCGAIRLEERADALANVEERSGV